MLTTPSPARPLFGPMALVLALGALAFVGFFPTYFGHFPRFVGTSAAIHFHVATLLLWLGFALAQALLVRRGRVDLHRRAGKLAYALIPLMLVGFALAIIDGQQRNKNPELIVATLFDGGLFLAFVALGLWHRRRPEHHRRYMILALLPVPEPPARPAHRAGGQRPAPARHPGDAARAGSPSQDARAPLCGRARSPSRGSRWRDGRVVAVARGPRAPVAGARRIVNAEPGAARPRFGPNESEARLSPLLRLASRQP
jgi:hypothetical protein